MIAKISRFLAERAIRSCSNRESIETAFEKFKISEKESRMRILIKMMGNPAISYSCGYPMIEDRYDAVVGTYLSGVWKRNYSSWKEV